jgi:hypothetical protein
MPRRLTWSVSRKRDGGPIYLHLKKDPVRMLQSFVKNVLSERVAEYLKKRERGIDPSAMTRTMTLIPI